MSRGWVFSVVLLLLFRWRVLRLVPPKSLALILPLVGYLGAVPAYAGQRTFMLAPADLVAAPDYFSAKALSRSASLGRAVGLKRGALRFAKSICPSLLADPTRRLTRVRLLGGPGGAPLVVGRTLASGLTDALTVMNAATWLPPATGKIRREAPGQEASHWVVEPPLADAIGFTTAGFSVGDQTGALGKSDAGNRIPEFRMEVNLASDPGLGSVDLAMALTIELPPTKAGKPGKRTECILVASLLPVDLQALRDLVNAAPLSSVTHNLLSGMVETAQTFLDRGKPDRAARNLRSFVLAVAQRTETEISPAFAEPMINRGNAAAEALSF